MAQSFTTDSIKELLAYPFKDPKWQPKLLIGGLCAVGGFLIVPMCFLYGYWARIMRPIIAEGAKPHLPEWEDWNELLRDGARIFGAIFVYNLPLVLGAMVIYATFIGVSISAEVATEGEFVPIVGMSVILNLFFAALMLVSTIINAFLPVIASHVVATGEFAAAFRVREWAAIFRANLSGFLVSYILLMGLMYALGFAAYFFICLCCLLPLIYGFIGVYAGLIASVLFGQAYREGVEKLAATA